MPYLHLRHLLKVYFDHLPLSHKIKEQIVAGERKQYFSFLVARHVGSSTTQRIEPTCSALEDRSLNHWNTREVPLFNLNFVVNGQWSS